MADRDTQRNPRLNDVTPKPLRALLVAVDLGDRDAPLAPEFLEFAALARATGVEIVAEMIQKLPHVDAGDAVRQRQSAKNSPRSRKNARSTC